MGELTKEYLNPEGLFAHPAYTNVVKVGHTVFIASQLPIDSDGRLVANDIDGQVRAVWNNLAIAMRAAGGTIHDIVSTWTYISAREHQQPVTVYRASLFPTNPPTSSRPIIGEMRFPGALVAISAIAMITGPSQS